MPENPNGEFIYNASLSPDKKKLVVYVGDIYTSGQNLCIYDVDGGYEWTIVKNTTMNYNAGTSFTGVYTGKTNEDNKLEVNTLLVDKVDVTIVTDIDVNDDEIIFEGVDYE